MDTLFVNGTIYTLEAPEHAVSAMLVRNGTVRGLGAAAELRQQAGRVKEVDLQGCTVLPSFTDAHIHFLHYGLGLARLQLENCSLTETLQRVRQAVAAAAPEQWILGRGFDFNTWNCGWPQGQWLDEMSRTHPIVLIAKDGHMVWLNQAAFAALGIDAATPNPKGGIIERDESGQPSGLAKETAADFVVQHLPKPSETERLTALRTAIERAYSYGITAVHTMEDSNTWRTWQQLRRQETVSFRGVLAAPVAQLPALLELGLQGGFGDEYLRFGAVKIFADGSLGSRTAWMLEPYEGEMQQGVIVKDQAELEELVEAANAGGMPVAVHAIGDGANRAVLNAIAAAGDVNLRNRLEHAQLLTPQDIPRLRQLNVVASMQPTQCAMDRYMAESHWGERCRTAYPFRSLLEHGTLLAFGSDAPVESPDVLLGLYSAVARKQWQEPDTDSWRPQEAVSLFEAVRAYTQGAATAANEETYRGTLALGQRADFVLLSEDIFRHDIEILKETNIEQVYFEGKLVHER